MLMYMHELPVKPEEGILDLFQLVPLKPGHLGVMPIPVVVAIASLSILIACSRHVTGWVPNLPKVTLQATGKRNRLKYNHLLLKAHGHAGLRVHHLDTCCVHAAVVQTALLAASQLQVWRCKATL